MMPKKHLLMTPGPTPVPEKALLQQARGMIHHRGPEYGEIISRVVENLRYVFQTERDVFIFTSSGTGAMESAVVNLFSPGDKVIVASTGNFGDRWANIASAYGLNVVKLEFEWGTRADVDTIKRAIEENPDARGVLCTHSETSTGVVNDVKAIAELTRDKDMVVVVDAVSGLGACELRTDAWGLDVVVSGSQKALMAPPGLAFATVSEKAWKFVEESKLPKFYFDYKKYQASIRKDPPQSPFTPAISTMLALGETLQMIREEGLENIWRKHIIFGRSVREAIKAIGLKLFSPDDDSSAAVTAVWSPEGIDPKQITTMMRVEYGITIAGGQGKVKGKIFRIGHCGYFQRSDIIATIDALESVLNRLGFPFEKCVGVLAAQKVFDSEGLY
jgi:aspartate aminotransferase-like enzyme